MTMKKPVNGKRRPSRISRSRDTSVSGSLTFTSKYVKSLSGHRNKKSRQNSRDDGGGADDNVSTGVDDSSHERIEGVYNTYSKRE